MAICASVIVPVYNEENSIKECVESLLNLEYPSEELELVIVDNNSDDGTPEILKNCSVKYVFEGKKGSYTARNTGIRNSHGWFLVFTDSDCVVDREWLKNLIDVFRDPSIGVVSGRVAAYKPETLVERYSALKALPQEEFSNRSIPFAATANAAFRKAVLEEVGFFDENFTSGGDEEVCWRIREKGYRIVYQPKAVVYHKHRKTLEGLFKQYVKYGEGQARLYKKYGKRQVDWRGYLSVLWSVFIRTPWRIVNSPVKKDKILYIATPLLDTLAQVGFKWGSIRGSLKHNTVFI
ncbi:MAG: glycosyltransferase [Candidatus Altiarchaeota archaeon]